MSKEMIIVLRNVLISRKKEYVPEWEDIPLVHLKGTDEERRLAVGRFQDAMWSFDSKQDRPCRTYPSNIPILYGSMCLRMKNSCDEHLLYYLNLMDHIKEICRRANVLYIASLERPNRL